MPKEPLNPKELGYYFSLAQVGLEMVVPVAVGLLLDNYFGWQPWGVVVGAVLGLSGGLLHLVALSNRRQPNDSSEPRQEGP